jgi:hypothetical protein
VTWLFVLGLLETVVEFPACCCGNLRHSCRKMSTYLNCIYRLNFLVEKTNMIYTCSTWKIFLVANVLPQVNSESYLSYLCFCLKICFHFLAMLYNFDARLCIVLGPWRSINLYIIKKIYKTKENLIFNPLLISSPNIWKYNSHHGNFWFAYKGLV